MYLKVPWASVDHRGVNPLVAEALEPSEPGRAVRVLSRVVPGVRTTRHQIADFSTHWRSEAEAALTETALPGSGPTLVAFGDSLAQGIGASDPCRGYVGLVAEAMGDGRRLPVLNLSRSGARIADVLNVQIPAFHAAAVTPRLAVCTVGSNDLLRSGRFSQTKAELSELLDALPEQTIVVTVPAAGSIMAKRFNRHLRAEAQRNERAVADLAARLTSWRGKAAKDGFHPNDAGYELWAEAILDASRQPT